ncbi:MAG: HsdR family type I site-specific deoxyribonuclease, partial [Patescibacteria group bacterium]|nr:HsdR family type I site-specific deoxyribonuclease [Patescibacteria group bacterium]
PVTLNGKKLSKNFRFIDFAHPDNNSYHVTVEFEAQGKGNIRPDIVVFVNGIPFSVIENKKSGVKVDEAINQMIRNQKPEKCPKLFVYPQLLVGTNKSEFKYGTTATPHKFYNVWKERDNGSFVPEEELNEQVCKLIAKPIDAEIHRQILADLNGPIAGHKQDLQREVSEQDRLVMLLFEPERLLDLTKNHILYDAGIKKIARYPQYFAIQKMLRRVEKIETVDGHERRGSGLLWHTQGSGKSLSMVMFVKALIEHPHIENPRIIIVTDRIDLDKQIAKTFRDCNLKKGVTPATSGEHLLKLIKDGHLNVITTLVHKFKSAANKRVGFVDESKDIFVLIDEAHRTQSGLANFEMERTIPNACYIGFTGTPLMKKEKESWRKFGGYIDKYTIDDALRDGVILPLIYEGRYVPLTQNKKQIDRSVERITAGLTDEQKRELQQSVDKMSIANNPQRIAEIAFDVERHYIHEFQGSGLKAQLVAPSKYSAVMFQKAFMASGQVNTALIISDESGIVAEDDTHRKEVIEYLQGISAKHSSLKKYEDAVIESFKHNEDGVEIIIVVDKLLTGFDAPRNTVLYLAKDLRDHNLLQAIARVNRLCEDGEMPKTAGYIIDYSENAKNIDTAMKLFGNFEQEDVAGVTIDVRDKVVELEKSYAALHEVFKGLGPKADDEILIQHLNDDAERDEFYEKLRDFVRVFSECLALRDFGREFKQVDQYRRELHKFVELRKSASVRYADEVDLSEYRRRLIDILDVYVNAEEVELLTTPVNITDVEKFEQAIEELGSDRSKAEAIAMQTEKSITENLVRDPEFYRRFSDKIKEILEQMHASKMADVEALKQLKLIKDKVINKKDDGVPVGLRDSEGLGIFYRNIGPELAERGLDEKAVEETVRGLFEVLEAEVIVDWYRNMEVRRVIRGKLDDYLYDVVQTERGVELDEEGRKLLVEQALQLAQNNNELFSV